MTLEWLVAIIGTPLSSIGDTGSFSYEKTSIRTSFSLRVIEDNMRLNCLNNNFNQIAVHLKIEGAKNIKCLIYTPQKQ
jgi:hypothetical protein